MTTRQPNLKAYLFSLVLGHAERQVDVVAADFVEANRTAWALAAPGYAYYEGVNMSLPGGTEHALRGQAVA